VVTNDTPLQKFVALGLPDYQVHHTEGGEWLNYTRLFSPGRYYVYLRLSSFTAQEVLFDEVTGDRTVANQTTVPVGKFGAPFILVLDPDYPGQKAKAEVA
jgi:hypothetical protein